MSSGQRVLFYLLSFFIPLVGIILGIVWMNDQDLEKKAVGKTCLIVAIIPIVLYCICWFVVTAFSFVPTY